jgi:hypothetical protein
MDECVSGMQELVATELPLRNLTVAQLVKAFPAFYRTQ